MELCPECPAGPGISSADAGARLLVFWCRDHSSLLMLSIYLRKVEKKNLFIIYVQCHLPSRKSPWCLTFFLLLRACQKSDVFPPRRFQAETGHSRTYEAILVGEVSFVSAAKLG